MDDLSLVRKYVEDGDQQAFAQVVRRHVDLVYSAARRQVSDPSAADDVTQLVFMTLARKARALRPGCVLAAWLLSVTRNVAMNANTASARRRRHELRAAQMETSRSDPERAVEEPLWDRVAPHLDEGVAALPEGRRRAIVLRYFEGKSVAEVAMQLQVSEDAAKQRLSRGVDQLRAFFAKRGVVVSGSALGVLVAAKALQAAPPATVAASTAAASAASAADAAGAGSLLMKGVAAVVALGKTKAIAVGLLVASLLSGTVAVVWSTSDGRGSDGARSVAAAGGAASAGDAREAAVSYSGVVRTADGRPISRAEVFFPASRPFFQPFFVSQMGDQNVPTVKTGPDGSFSSPAQRGVGSIVVRCSAGYAQVPAREFAPGTVITVQPWGRVEGVALGKPAARRSIVLDFGGGPDLVERGMTVRQWTVQTDDEGRFTFPRVTPGTASIAFTVRQDTLGSGLRTGVQIEPGRTAQVTLGRQGRAVVGQIVPSRTEERYRFTGMIWPALEPTTQPEAAGSVAGRPVYPVRPSPFDFRVVTDDQGVLRVDDVPPGRYRLAMIATVENAIGRSIMLETAADAQADITIPPAETGDPGEPFDIGTIPASLVPRMKPGDEAPPFAATTLDTGGPVGLADYRGKYLVLNLRLPPNWGLPDDPPRLAAVWDRFAGDPRFSFLSLCVDERVPTPNSGTNARQPERWAAAEMSQVSPLHLTMPGNTSNVIDPEGKLLGKWQDGRGVFSLLDNAPFGRAPQPQGGAVVVDHNALDASTAGFKFRRVGRRRGECGGLLDRRRQTVRGRGRPVRSQRRQGAGRRQRAGRGILFRALDAHRPAPRRPRTGRPGAGDQHLLLAHEHALPPGVQGVRLRRGGARFRPGAQDRRRPGTFRVDPDCVGGHPPEASAARPGAWGGQDAASVRPSGAATLGRYRYLLFITFVTETGDGYGHTFFNEIDVVTHP